MFEALVILTVAWILTLAVVGYTNKLMDPQRFMPKRSGNRLPEREYELLGEDYRDVIEDYFARKAERDERRERAIRGR